MSIAGKVGTLKQAKITEIWPEEDRNFTPWLADNLHEISAALRLELELLDQEAPAGSFRLDILAREIWGKGLVVIENQFGPSDHAHLGQLLTYAAELNARKAVWVAERFSDEHKRVLRLLNRGSSKETKLYGVAIEVFRIDDSRPAFKFDAVVVPDEWHGKDPDSAFWRRQVLNREFIRKLDSTLRRLKLPERKGTTNDRSSYRIIDYPKSFVRYAAIWHFDEPGFEIVIDRHDRDGDFNRAWNSTVYRALEKDRKRIEEELRDSESECFAWKSTGDSDKENKEKQSYIRIIRKGSVYDNKDTWDELQDWMISKFHRFEKVLEPRLDEIWDTRGL